jgi:GNAT superfamily N-acetyltransferase
MNITAFRLAQLDDADAIVALVNAAYHPAADSGAWTHESDFVIGSRTDKASLLKLFAKDDSLVLLGLHDETIIACVHVEISADHAHIGMLAVNPSYQNAGLGKQMLAAAENYAHSHFKVQQFMLIVIALRHELIAFYQRRGYQKTEVMIDYATLCGDTCDAKIADLKFTVLEKSL